MRRILISNDTRPGTSGFSSLIPPGCSVTMAENSARVLDKLIESRFDLLVINLSAVDDCVELIRDVRRIETAKRIPILVIGDWGTGLPSLAMSAGADAYEASANPARLIESIERLLPPRAAVAGAGE